MSPAQIYSSPWHHPGLLLPLSLAGLAYVLVLRARHPHAWSPFLRAWLLAWAVEIALDASLTGFATPLHGHPGAERVASIVFVILGDLRAYLLLERLASPSRHSPSVFASGRHVFLFYESLSIALFALWRFAIVPRLGPSASASLARDVATFFLVQYALWASSDVLILSGIDLAYLLRIVPNVLYYGLFVAFVAWRAPRELRA